MFLQIICASRYISIFSLCCFVESALVLLELSCPQHFVSTVKHENNQTQLKDFDQLNKRYEDNIFYFVFCMEPALGFSVRGKIIFTPQKSYLNSDFLKKL